MSLPRNDLAIYSPGSAPHYEVASPEGEDRRSRTGGAELQTTLLARTLAERGRSVAHIVWPLRPGSRQVPSGVTLVERPDHRQAPRWRRKAMEIGALWRAMGVADARVYLFRGSGIQLFVGALFCRLRGRRLLFAAANDLDFDLHRGDRGRLFLTLYRLGLREVSAVVVQTGAQRSLALHAGLPAEELALIRSFAEEASLSAEPPAAFLWAGRLVDYKRPLEYLRLAEALPELRFIMVAVQTDETSPQVAAAVRDAERRLDNLTVLSTMPRSSLLALIERSFAVASTSSHEGMPNVFLEAWARGIPAVSLSFDPDGLIEERGLGYACGDRWEDFVRAVKALGEDEELRGRFSATVSRYVGETHSIEAVADRWDAQLAALLTGDPRA